MPDIWDQFPDAPIAPTKPAAQNDPWDAFPDAPAPQQTAAPQRGPVEDVVGGLGSGFNQGFDATINGIANAATRGPAFIANLPFRAAGVEAPFRYPTEKPLDIKIARQVGDFEPQTTAGRVSQAVGEAVGSSVFPYAGTATVAAKLGTAAPAFLQSVAQAPKAAAGAELASTVGSGVGVGLAREADAGPIGELAAGIAGAMAPGALIGKARVPRARVEREELLSAANRRNIDIQEAAANSNPLVRFGAAKLGELPVAGSPIKDSAINSLQQLDNFAANVAPKSSTPQLAGADARDAISNWIQNDSAEIGSKLYGDLDALITRPDSITPLKNTASAFNFLKQKQAAGASKVHEPALNVVEEAVSRPGLTYEGIKLKRTELRGKIDSYLTPDTEKAGLQNLYDALGKDLRVAVRASSDSPGEALNAFNRANETYAEISKKRKNLYKIVGVKGDATPAEVFGRLTALAGSTARADVNRLKLAKDTMGSKNWESVTSAVVNNLGRDADDVFSPDRFITGYGKIDSVAKDTLFGVDTSYRKSLEDIATISRGLKGFAKLGNPSGTGGVVGISALVTGLMTNTVPTVAGLGASRLVAEVLARPATAKPLAKLMKVAAANSRRGDRANVAALNTASAQLLAAMQKEGLTGEEQPKIPEVKFTVNRDGSLVKGRN